LREKFLFFCTCTGLEILTAVGVTGYLFHLEEYVLSLISMIVFGKLILFHFIMEYFDRKKLQTKNPHDVERIKP
jgi:hypothetical protein